METIIGKEHSFLLPKRIKELSIPRAIIENKKHKAFLKHTVERFGHEEQQAILYCLALENVTIEDVVKAVDLSHNHVTSTLLLFAERWDLKLTFLKDITPHDEQDRIPIEELLTAHPS